MLLSGYLQTTRASEALPSVELHLQDKQASLTEPAQQQLHQQALQLLETSNFHSGPGDKYHFFTLLDVESEYRKTVMGKFLVITFPTPQKITTVGGEITVLEIIVGLNGNDYASSLFTIDDSGRVIEHSKYSGTLSIEILKTAKHFVHNA